VAKTLNWWLGCQLIILASSVACDRGRANDSESVVNGPRYEHAILTIAKLFALLPVPRQNSVRLPGNRVNCIRVLSALSHIGIGNFPQRETNYIKRQAAIAG